MACLEIRAGRRRKVFQILDREFSVGRGEENVLRITNDAVKERHLRFVQVGARHRVEAAGGADLRVNGHVVGPTWLAHGDRIDVGPVVLVYCEDGEPRPADDEEAADAPEPVERVEGGFELRIDTIPSARPERAAGPHRGRHKAAAAEAPPRRAVRRRGMPRAVLAWNVALVTAVVGYLVFHHFASVERPRGSRDLITLAESQRAAGSLDRALATLGLALESATEPETRARIRALQRQIQDDLQLRADMPALERARTEREGIRRYVGMHLADDPRARPQARELVRMARAWLDAYRDVCVRHENERPFVDEIEDYLRRYRDAAHEGEPDTAEDVLFAAGRRARFLPRRYPEGIRILQEWLVKAPADAPGRADVEARVAELREQGKLWLDEQRQAVERMVGRGGAEIDRAISTLRDLIENAALPEWLGDAPERLRQLERDRR